MEDLELGTLLKKARKNKGLTIDQIQEETKIRKKYLEAIENNDYDVLPGSVYLKVFVKGYARLVDLDYQALLDNYPVLHKTEEKKNTQKQDYLSSTNLKPKSSRKRNYKSIFKWIFFIFLGIVLIAASIFAYQYFTNAELRLLNQETEQSQQESIEPTAPSDNGSPAVLDDSSESSADDETDQNDNQTLENDTGTDQNEDSVNQDNNDTETGLEDDLNSENSLSLEDDTLDTADSTDTAVDTETEGTAESTDTAVDTETEDTADSTDQEDALMENQNLSNSETDANEQIEENTADDSTADDGTEQNLAEESQAEQNSAAQNQTDENQTVDSQTAENMAVENEAKIPAELSISSSEQVWMNIDADGEDLFTGILETDQNLNYDIESRLYMKIGIAGAVAVEINGQEYGPFAAEGQIAEVEFLFDGEDITFNNLRAN